jgi:hypothetical protein
MVGVPKTLLVLHVSLPFLNLIYVNSIPSITHIWAVGFGRNSSLLIGSTP